MDDTVTASFGPMGPLLRQLHLIMALEQSLPEGISGDEILLLQEGLAGLCVSLKDLSKLEDPSFTARCWMKEVRELCYDTVDFFDEVMRSRGRRSAFLSIILWILSKLNLRPQIAKNFSELLLRVKDTSQRWQSFDFGRETIKSEFGQVGVSLPQPELSLQLLEEPMDELAKLLEDQKKQNQVVSIFGFAGVGKTILARTFYHNFGGKFKCRAFIRVSRNPDMRRLLISMLSQIKAPSAHGFPDVQALIDCLREHLQGKRYLIIIDDLWATSTWDIVRRAFPDGDYCSRIITTTQIKDVALACCRYQLNYIYEMSPLNADQSRKLFLGRVFGSGNGYPSNFQEVTNGIIRKCEGLPLATVNIASILASEPNLEQWKHIRDSLPSNLSLRTSPEGMKEVLNIIYNNLSPHLKTCLLYLIMYPEGYTIRKYELVKLWVAEGFIQVGQNREKIAGGYFDELVSRGMIQPVDRNCNDEVLTCTVHHTVLDLIRYKSLEENFVITLGHSPTTTGLEDKVRRLSVQFLGAKCATIPAGFMMSQVRSLIYFGFSNCVPSVADYKFLRVLILHIWADETNIISSITVGELFLLRYLKVECNSTVRLPGNIRGLQYLETLELHAPVVFLPWDIIFLKKLLQLILPTKAMGMAQNRIGCMTSLRILGNFNLSKNSTDNVESLGMLSNLQDLHLTCSDTAESDNLNNNMQCLGSIIWKLSNLKFLTLAPAALSHADVLNDAGGTNMSISSDVLSRLSSPSTLLQRLKLSRRCCVFSSLPEWTKELTKLCILKIAVRKLSRKDIDILKGLPALTSLSLYIWTAPVGRIVFDKEGFPVLKYFKFICTAPCVSFLEGAMPTTRRLKLGFNASTMDQYSLIAAGYEHLTGLKEITAKIGGVSADESERSSAESSLRAAISVHPDTLIIRVKFMDIVFHGEEDNIGKTQEEEQWPLENENEIQEEVVSYANFGKNTRMFDGEEDCSTEEHEHRNLEKQYATQIGKIIDVPIPDRVRLVRRVDIPDPVHFVRRVDSRISWIRSLL